ncbi:MAG: Hsp20/alpha crystallin family protein [Kineosporiaceae bacterium]|jgi:HSP20 family molecular chaperone IbpA
MTGTTQVERRGRTPRLFDWLESEFSLLPGLRPFEFERFIRCEEFVEDGSYVVRAQLPGVDPDKDVEVTVADGVLTIHAERRETRKDAHRSEFFYGELTRTLRLPKGADESAVTATYRDGILEVTVAVKPEEAAAKKVPIERGR